MKPVNMPSKKVMKTVKSANVIATEIHRQAILEVVWKIMGRRQSEKGRRKRVNQGLRTIAKREKK